jgi:hypothetical protein
MVNGWHNMLRYLPKYSAGTMPDSEYPDFPSAASKCSENLGPGMVMPGKSGERIAEFSGLVQQTKKL